jgi:integrase
MLQNFFDYHQMKAAEFILLARRTPVGEPQFKIEKMIMDFLDYRWNSGRAKSTVAKEATVIQNFFRTNNVFINGQSKYTYKPNYESKRILSQKEVTRMMRAARTLEQKALICFEAQTAQRIGILTGLQFNMIHRYPQKDGKVYGIIEIKPEIADPKGVPVGNKKEAHYKFGVHWQSMRFIDRVRAKADDKEGWIWQMGIRQMEQAISGAAKRAGIQKATPTRIRGRDWHEVHPHVFRRFWMARMDDAGVTKEYIRDYQIGHTVQSKTYYWGTFTDEKILKAMKKADKYLRVY